LKGDDVILGGDLNLTLNEREIWGEVARKDTLANFLCHFLEDNNVLDVEHGKLVTTWKNVRRGGEGILKSLIES